MFSRSSNTKKPTMGQSSTDSLEKEAPSTLAGFGSSLAKNVGESFADLGTGMFDQLLSMNENTSSQNQSAEYQKGYQDAMAEKEQKSPMPERKTLFSFGEQQERQQMHEIKELIHAIKQEVDAIKKADQSLMGEVKDIEKLTINSMPDKPGIYHVRFLELVLKVLQTLRMKLNESNTWMEALHSKKAKRGSAFASRSKKQGTSYSQSEELKVTRNSQ